jgi:hypothetical protein
LEPFENSNSKSPNSSFMDDNNLPVVGLQFGLKYEPETDHIDSGNASVGTSSTNIKTNSNSNLSQQQSAPQVIFQNETATITLDNKPKESTLSVRTGPLASQSLTNLSREQNLITEEMQLKAAYELQLWKEAKEKEFEQNVYIFVIFI